MDFNRIDQLIEKSRTRFWDAWLESLQDKFGDRQTYYRFLYHLALETKPAVALEIGTYFGVGSAHLAAAAATYGGQVIGIDLNNHEMMTSLIPERFGNYHFIQADSTRPETVESVRRLVEKYGPLGIVYQDSSHHYEASRQEWAAYRPMMATGGIWICDDITPAFHDPLIDPPGLGMVQYFEGLPGQKRLYKDVLHFGNTQGVVVVGES